MRLVDLEARSMERVLQSHALMSHLLGQTWLEETNSEVERFNSLSKDSNDELGDASGQEFDNGAEAAFVLGGIDELVALFGEALADWDDLDVGDFAIRVEKA